MLIHRIDDPLHETAIGGYASLVWSLGYGFKKILDKCHFEQSEKSIALIVKDYSRRSE